MTKRVRLYKKVTYVPVGRFVNPTTRNGSVVHHPSGPKSLPLCGKRMSPAQPVMWTDTDPNCSKCLE